MRQWPDLIGQHFGMLLAIRQAESTASGQRRWACRYNYGNEYIANGFNLIRRVMISNTLDGVLPLSVILLVLTFNQNVCLQNVCFSL